MGTRGKEDLETGDVIEMSIESSGDDLSAEFNLLLRDSERRHETDGIKDTRIHQNEMILLADL